VKQTSNIGKNIKARREAKGWTQELLAEITGIHRVTIARYETTDGGMNIETAKKLASALGCSVGDLLADDDK